MRRNRRRKLKPSHRGEYASTRRHVESAQARHSVMNGIRSGITRRSSASAAATTVRRQRELTPLPAWVSTPSRAKQTTAGRVKCLKQKWEGWNKASATRNASCSEYRTLSAVQQHGDAVLLVRNATAMPAQRCEYTAGHGSARNALRSIPHVRSAASSCHKRTGSAS